MDEKPKIEETLVVLTSSPKQENKKIKKKKKAKKKKKPYEEIILKKNVIKSIEEQIENCENIPQVLKRKYKKIETNPSCLILTYLPLKVTAEELREYFGTILISQNPKYEIEDIRPVSECEIGETKRFAVLELVDSDCVVKLLQIGRFDYNGAKMIIRRPKRFFVKHYEGGRYEFDENGVLKNLDAGEEVRLYMGNIPQYMTDEMVKKLVESFGQLKTFEMKSEFSMGEALSKGYCFFEYYDSRNAEIALQKLHDLEIGDKKLRVQRINLSDNNKNEGNKKAPTKESETSFLLMFPKLRDPFIQAALSVPSFCVIPSRVIQLLNMCTPEDLFDEEFLIDLKNDVKEECGKYGKIDKIDIPVPDQKTGRCSSSVGKIFVKFAYILAAKQARYRINGLSYNRRTVIASFFPENKFDN